MSRPQSGGFYPMSTLSIRNLAFAVAIAACLSLASCKDEKPPSTETPTLPSKSAAPSTGESATAKFDKPLKADGDVRIELITNGTSPFWDALDKGLDAEKGVLKCTA